MKILRPSHVRLGIAGKIYLGALIIAVFGFVLYFAIAWVIAETATQLYFTHEIDEVMADMEGDLTREVETLVPVGDFISTQKEVGTLLRAHDTAGLTAYFAPLIQKGTLDAVTVLDKQGIDIVHLGPGNPLNQGVSAPGESGQVQIASSFQAGGLQPYLPEQLRASYRVNLRDEQNAEIGSLIVACYLDDHFLRLSMKPGRADRVLIYDGEVVASTWAQVDHKPFVGQMAPAEVLAAEKEGKPSELVSLETDRGMFLVRFVPLQTPNHVVVGMYGAGISQEELTSHRVGLLLAFGVGFLIALVAMSVVGSILARMLRDPIHFLRSAVETMASGDLSKKVAWHANDELGDLAEQIEHMRKQMRQALDMSHRLQASYATAIHDMGIGALFTDSQHRITSVNAVGEQLLKQNETSLVGQPWHQVFVTNERTDAAVPLSWNLQESGNGSGSNATIRGRFPLRAHPETVLEMISSPIRLGDEVTGYISVLNDTSAQEQFAKIKEDFVLNVAHELRGPLSALRVSVDLLMEDYMTISQRDLGVMLRNLQRVIFRFQGLVESLVDVGNIQAGRFRVRPSAISVENLIADAVQQVSSMAEARSQRIETYLDGAPSTVLADRRRISQVLVNLLTNASKYGPEERPICLSTMREDGFVRFSVSDEGDGIPLEDQGLVFERFFRVKRHDEEGSGIGIGLALAKGIIEAHGGKINLVSQPGRGTTFWFTLPAMKASEEPWAVQPDRAGRAL